MARCEKGQVLANALAEVEQDARTSPPRPQYQIQNVRVALAAHDAKCWACTNQQQGS